MSGGTKAFLGALPFRIDLRPAGGHRSGSRIILVHAAPTVNTLYWTEDRDDAFCLNMAGIAGAREGDSLAFGHTHLAWDRRLGGITFLNTGSVGRPKDGDWRAGYTVLHVADEEPTVEHVRVEYDIDRTMQAIFDSDLPDEFGHFLRSGGTSLEPPDD